MKKLIASVLAISCCVMGNYAAADDEIKLPMHNLKDNVSLKTALEKRKTSRVFSREKRLLGDKIIEKSHGCPCGSTVVGGTVVPTEIGSEIHGAAPRQQALRGEIGAVPPSACEIEKQRISTQCPGFGIGNGTFSIVGLGQDHSVVSFRSEEWD